MTTLSKRIVKNFMMDVDMMYTGAIVTISVAEDSGETYYQVMASRRMMKVMRAKPGTEWEDIIPPNLTMDPMNPTDEEVLLIDVMLFNLNKFEKGLYELGCNMSRLYNNNADAGYTRRYVDEFINARLEKEV